LKILQDNPVYRKHARARAETTFGLGEMVTGYLAALEAK